MKGINDIPIELYLLIFKNLSIKDLFNCRLVNKKFKFSTYESINKLVIRNLNDYNDYWYYNNDLINENDTISFACFRKIRSLSIFNLNKCLKYLRINLYNYRTKLFEQELLESILSNLNIFKNLKCLELDLDMYLKTGFNFNLNNLKYLAINNLNKNNHVYELNTPKLKKIKFNYIKNISIISNPESIRHLIALKYEDQLKIFKNIEIIEITHTHESKLNENLLSFFKNLKKLKIDLNGDISNFNKVEDKLIKILEIRMKLNKDIVIYLEGVKIMNNHKLVEIKSYKNILEYQINNYDLLDSILPRINEIEYDKLNNCINNIRNDLPSSFFNKYQNISIVYVYELKGVDNLIWFLNNLKGLKQLDIDIILNQNFFNNLPNTIKFLEIYDYDEKSPYLKINFDFILKLTKLIKFKIRGFNIDIFNLALASFSNLKYLNLFVFEFKDNVINIYKEDNFFF